MKILKVGDKTKSACDNCKAFVNASYQLRNVPFSDNSDIVKNVLVGVCDCCDAVISLPHQSTPLVKKQLEKQKGSIESRVPSHLIDILNLASFELSGSTDFVPMIVRYYLHNLSTRELSAKNIDKYLTSDLAKGKAQKRLSIKGRNVISDIENLKKITHISSTSDLIKSIILRINDDILLQKHPKSKKILKNLVAISS
ncbi:MAG: hypothetical protein GQ569_04150 [Methylococcaceae bacterium]|nr:hypothetical protein [Methylococcaceae bacterium]